MEVILNMTLCFHSEHMAAQYEKISKSGHGDAIFPFAHLLSYHDTFLL